MLPFVFMALMLMNNTVNGQGNKQGDVPVVYPSGGFAVDGDAFAGFPKLYVGDWWESQTPGSTGGSVFTSLGVLIPPPAKTEAAFFMDNFKTGDLNVFALSNKINDNPNTYTIKAGNVPPKDDMQRSIAVFTWGDPTLTTPNYAATGNANDLWCLFAADRWEVNGSAYIDFEFNQNAIIVNPDGTVTTEAPLVDADGDPTGGRTPGDILITTEFVRGGGVGNLYVDRWSKDGLGQAYYWKTVDLSLPQYATSIFATHNEVAELAPWPIYDQVGPPYTYAIDQYAEGAINLTQIMGVDAKCGHFATVWVRTKSSHSSTAELKDLGGIASLNVGAEPPVANCSTINVPACTSEGDMNTAFTNWKASFTKTSGTGTDPVNATFDPPLPPSLPDNAECGYTFTTTYTLTDYCGKTDSCIGTFTIAAPTAIGYTNPVNADEKSCDYANQDAVDSAFTAWIAAQTTALEGSITGGCKPEVSNGGGTAPVLCEGGTATVTWTITDLCETISTITADFKLTAPTAIGYTNPVDADEKSCDYANQDAVDSAFTAWIAAQTTALEGSITGGCKPEVSNGGGTAPVLCEGGTATVTWTITDLCETISTITADFKLTAPTAVVVSDVQDMSTSACLYANQAAVDAAFANWLKGFSTSGGCDPKGSYGTPEAPELCGGSTEVTYTIKDLCDNTKQDVATFTITAPDPLVISDVKDILIPSCSYGTQVDLDAAFALWLKDFTVSGGCDPQGVFEATYTAPDRVTGGFVDVVYNVTDLCESGNDTARYTVEPCVSAHCTYTQGYYGNPGGMSCADGEKLTTVELIAKALGSYGGTMTIGMNGHTIYMTSPDDIDDIIRVLPGGGSSYPLFAGNIRISEPGFSAYLKKGNINNTLLAQTITLGLNLGIDSTLGGFGLQAGMDPDDKPIKLATAKPESCGSAIPMPRSCSEEGYIPVINEYEYFQFPAFVNGMTVQELFTLANTALGGGTIPEGMTLSGIASAVDMVNNAFDGCRISMGYGIEPLDCLAASKQDFVAFEVPIVNNQLTIKYKFSYVSDVTIDVFDAVTGAKLFSKLDSNSYFDKEVKLDYNFNTGTQKVYIVRLTTRLGHDEQKVMSSPY